MASGFPGAIDSFTNPLTTSALNSPSHAGQHQDLNDAVNKIETYMGLVKVVPTSVSAGNTLASNGTITIGSAQTTVSINGCFSSLYDNYRVMVRIPSSSGANDCRMRFRAGGADNTSAAYSWYYVGLDNAGTSLNSNSGGQNYAYTGTSVSGTGINASFEFDVLSPFLAEETRFYGFGFNRTVGGMRVGGFQQSDNTSFDGFTLYPSANSWTGGTITIYGYRK